MQARELANWVCEKLEERGHEALLAGGCVRDLVLGREPVDFDVATDAKPGEVMAIFPESVAVGARFGVVLVPREGNKVEVATFRSDLGYSDGRHPDAVVYATTAEEDVLRRDFTINGLLMRHDTGEVLDYVRGRADLAAGVVRAIGEAERRFREDKLRMLRAVRFAARFGYAIEPQTFAAIRLLGKEIHSVSAERIREELTKILTEGSARRGFELLEDSGLLGEILPEVAAMRGVEQPPEFHPEGDVWIHTRMMLGGLPAGVSPELAWGVLLHDVGKPPTFRPASVTGDRIRFDDHVGVGVKMAEEICRRLRFSNEAMKQILALVGNHMKFKDVSKMKQSTLKRFVRLPEFAEHLELHRLDCGASHGKLDTYNEVLRFVEQTPAEEVRPERLLNGDDLQQMGYAAGPQFQKMLASLEDAQLEGAVRSREEAVEFVNRKYALLRKADSKG